MMLTSHSRQANIYQHLTLLRQNGLVCYTFGKPAKTHFSPGSKGGHSAIQAQMESYSLKLDGSQLSKFRLFPFPIDSILNEQYNLNTC